ncbi:MAG: glycosyltransferase [Alphaproteobacteria bacterium]|nr:MAG: glycosyltransferase [Alphaproteobacteria bacterium]
MRSRAAPAASSRTSSASCLLRRPRKAAPNPPLNRIRHPDMPHPGIVQGMAEKLLSIIIPTRNQARTLEALLHALARLRPVPGWRTEIIAGYQESADDTLNVLHRHGVHVVHSTTIGAGPARNAAAAAARGELLWFIDSDARPLDTDFLIRLIAAVRRRRRFGVIGGPIVLPPEWHWHPIAIADHFACWFNWSECRPSGPTRLFQPTVSIVMPRGVFTRVGGFDESVRVMQDFEIQTRILRAGYPIYFERSLPVAHAPRSSLLRTCRHSWYWGGPFRDIYLRTVRTYPLRHPVDSPLFAANVPGLFVRRMRLVLRTAWRVSRWQTCYCLPFLAVTILAWTLGVAFGEGRPGPHVVSPV